MDRVGTFHDSYFVSTLLLVFRCGTWRGVCGVRDLRCRSRLGANRTGTEKGQERMVVVPGGRVCRTNTKIQRRRQQQHRTRVSCSVDSFLHSTALHPDSVQSFQVGIGQNELEAWEADPDLTAAGEMQEIPGVEGLTGSDLYIYGDMEIGESLRILEV